MAYRKPSGGYRYYSISNISSASLSVLAWIYVTSEPSSGGIFAFGTPSDGCGVDVITNGSDHYFTIMRGASEQNSDFPGGTYADKLWLVRLTYSSVLSSATLRATDGQGTVVTFDATSLALGNPTRFSISMSDTSLSGGSGNHWILEAGIFEEQPVSNPGLEAMAANRISLEAVFEGTTSGKGGWFSHFTQRGPEESDGEFIVGEPGSQAVTYAFLSTSGTESASGDFDWLNFLLMAAPITTHFANPITPSLADYAENKLVDAFTGKASWSPTPYLAYSTAAPGEDGTGLAEPSGNGYSRTQILAADMSAAATDTATTVTKTNANAITTGAASGSWGTLTHLAIMDGAAGSNVIWWGELASGVTVASGESVEIAAGALDVFLDNAGSDFSTSGGLMQAGALRALDQTFGDPNISHTLYAGLLTAMPASWTASATEASYTGYARLTLTAATWSSASSGSSTYGAALTFGENTGTSQNIVGVGLWDASSGGTLLYAMPLTSMQAVPNGAQPALPTNSLVLTVKE